MFLGFCFRRNGVNTQAASTGKATRKSVHKSVYEEFASFIFVVYIISVCVKFDDFFPNGEEKKKPIHKPIVKKIHPLESAQYAFLDHSKTLFRNSFLSIPRATKILRRATLIRG